MTATRGRWILLGLLVALLAALSQLAPRAARGRAATAGAEGEANRLDPSVLTSRANAEPATATPAPVPGPSQASLATPERNPCLHCHLGSGDEGLWTPLARWTLFGSAGLVLAFGVYRGASVWVTRVPWKPLAVRTVDWIEARYQLAGPLEQALRKEVPRHARRWWYCLGGITAFLFGVQAVTGTMLAFYYTPTPDAAYASIQYIETEVRFGAAVRAVHHWCANGMIVMCLAHMLRVFVMGAYKPPRELNWVNGVLLLVATLAFGFTGYLLPWDQRAFWATTVGSEIAGSVPVVGTLALVFLRGGWDVSGLTLSRFYGLHVLVLPLGTVALLGLHFLMVRRLGVAKPL